jgi:hypothetical protein
MTKQELINKIEELKQEKNKLKDLANVQNLRQHAFKIFLNSSYGALGSAFYPCFDLDNAEAVTLSGQSVTREMVRFTNEILNKLAGTENDEFVVAGDTDSVDKNTLVYLNNSVMTIEELFKDIMLQNYYFVLTNGTELAYNHDKNLTTKSLYGDSRIINVSRHKVTKERWLISIDNVETYITKDHSLMILRDEEVIQCKPENLRDTDFLFNWNSKHFELRKIDNDKVIVKPFGQFEDEYVYDIEVADGLHTFVANNVLAHNSCVNITKIKLSDGEVTIEELYNMIFDENKHVITLQNGTQIVETLSKDHYISGVNGETKIKNISRRKVSKKCYNIEIPGKEELKLTEDHSIIVYRDNKLIECKPYEILETDFLVIK